jgi:hypothetical protein
LALRRRFASSATVILPAIILIGVDMTSPRVSISFRGVRVADAADHRPAAEKIQPFPFRKMVRADPRKKLLKKGLQRGIISTIRARKTGKPSVYTVAAASFISATIPVLFVLQTVFCLRKASKMFVIFCEAMRLLDFSVTDHSPAL